MITKREGNLASGIMFAVSIIVLIAAYVLWANKENNDYKSVMAAQKEVDADLATLERHHNDMAETVSRMQDQLLKHAEKLQSVSETATTATELAHRANITGSRTKKVFVEVSPISVRSVKRATPLLDKAGVTKKRQASANGN